MFKKLTKIQDSFKKIINIYSKKYLNLYGKCKNKTLSIIKYLFVKLKKINFKKRFENVLSFILNNKQKCIAYLSAFVIFLGTFVVIPITHVSALEVSYKDEIVGYVANQKTANSAKAKVVKDTECKSDYVEKVLKKDLTTKNAFVSSNNLIEKEKLSENIVEAIEELEAGYGVYIDEELYCSFKNKKEIDLFKNELNSKIFEKFKTNDYRIASDLTYSEGNYFKNTIKKYNTNLVVDVLNKLTIEHYKYKEKKKVLDFDIVYMSDKNFTLGETEVVSKGKKGKVKYTFKIIFQDDKRVKRVLDKTDIIKAPKAEIIKISEEEYKILSANNLIKNNNFAFPLKTNNYYISSLYGYRWGRIHHGIDLACDLGTSIVSYKSGIVIESSYDSGYGKYVVVEHKNGLKTLYAHCDSLLAGVGDKVKKGQVIALAGNTGNSTGPHLHFEVRLNEERVNPAKYLGLFTEDSKDLQKFNTVPQPINLTGEKLEFVESIKFAAIEAYQHYNILPSLTISQAIIESAWGKSAIGNNIFGIKAFSDWKGKKQFVWTSEENSDGTKYRCQAWFKDYDSIIDSVRDHSKLLLNSRYDAVRQATNYREACYAVKAAGYATSSDYAETLINVIETYGLYAWDDINYKIEGEYGVETVVPEEETQDNTVKSKTTKKNKNNKSNKSNKTTKKNKNNKNNTTKNSVPKRTFTTAVVTENSTTTVQKTEKTIVSTNVPETTLSVTISE